jgi:hypothetical protein
MTGSRSRLPNTRKTAKRSNRWKLPVETAIITTAAEARPVGHHAGWNAPWM